MAKGFYSRLAVSNLLRSKRMYGPYCLASALMSGMFFINLNLVLSRSIANLEYGGTVVAMFTIGIVVMALFTVGYMLYINSFLIKKRKKEFGLYGVLGMERRHVARVILWENATISFGSVLLGLLFGVVFGRLAFLLLMRLLDTAAGSTYVISIPALLLTLVMFAGVFILTTLYNLNQVRLANPVDLLKGEQKGEKKVRFIVPITILGALMLGGAYYMAISVSHPAMALLEFWPAVILVIIATWLLFTGGSAFILNALQRNKRIYYKPRNFITISGLRHRMKQNAAGLSNICILSTMVMVTVSCCLSLYVGREVILKQQNSSDISVVYRMDDAAQREALYDEVESMLMQAAEQTDVQVQSWMRYHYQRTNLPMLSDIFKPVDGNALQMGGYSIFAITAADYAEILGEEVVLAENEVLLLTHEELLPVDVIPAEGGDFHVKEYLQDSPLVQMKNSVIESSMFIIVHDEDARARIIAAIDAKGDVGHVFVTVKANVSVGQTQGLAFTQALEETMIAPLQEAAASVGGNVNHTSIFVNRVEGYGLYGGLLFMGVFFALLFLINTALILYFKQVSEGVEDSERFAILQKVGLSDLEVRQTINRQMLIVFMMPLLVALLHLAAASNMMRWMLATFMLTDFTLTIVCILATCAVFVVVYLFMYRMTARTYYKQVRGW